MTQLRRNPIWQAGREYQNAGRVGQHANDATPEGVSIACAVKFSRISVAERLSYVGESAETQPPQIVSSACFKSPMMSAMSSVPTDKRTKSGVTPVETCSANESCW